MNPDWAVQPSLEVCASQCGSRCCKGPGYLALTFDECQDLFIQCPIRVEVTNAHGTFHMRDTQRVYLHFVDQVADQCPYLGDDGGCGIHDRRPEACRTFPDHPAEYCLVWPKVHAED